MKRIIAAWVFGILLIGAAIANKDDAAVFIFSVVVSVLVNVTLAIPLLRRVLWKV